MPTTGRSKDHSRRPARVAAVLLVLLALPALVLTGCPAARDGMPGQLARAKEEAQSAARAAALTLDLWTAGRATRQLAAVQVADARDEVVDALEGTAVLRAEDPVDLRRQTVLCEWMAETVGLLNSADGVIRGHAHPAAATRLRDELLAGVRRLDDEYP
jgi:hypothetical protein